MSTQSDYVTLTEVEVGRESPFGEAVRVKIGNVHHWLPLSQVRAIHRNTRVRDGDSIEVARWLADKEGWEY